MHPIFGHPRRLLLYLAAWLPPAGLLAVLVAWVSGLDATSAAALAMPLGAVIGFLCLGAWYPARSMPLRRERWLGAAGVHLLGAAVTSSLWQLALAGWAAVLGRFEETAAVPAAVAVLAPAFFPVGVLVYLLTVAVCYLTIAVESSRRAEKAALEARRQEELAARDLSLARAIQQRLLPPAEASGPGWRIAARNLPAQVVAGDFYDYFTLPDGTLRIAVADVAGKGIGAALIMASVKAVLPLVAAGRGVVETLGELNRKLAGELGRREFVALALAAFDPASGRLELVNAGLPDPYRVAGGRALEAIVAPWPRLPLGVRAGLDYQSVGLHLEPGDSVVFLTDGLPEAETASGEPLGYPGLERLVATAFAADGVDGVLAGLGEAAERADDWTILALSRSPSSPSVSS